MVGRIFRGLFPFGIAYLILYAMFVGDFSNNLRHFELTKNKPVVVLHGKSRKPLHPLMQVQMGLILDDMPKIYIPKGALVFDGMRDEYGSLGIIIKRYYRSELDWDTEGTLR